MIIYISGKMTGVRGGLAVPGGHRNPERGRTVPPAAAFRGRSDLSGKDRGGI